MFWLVLGLTVAAALAAFVLMVVAIPALRDGRQILTPRGEKLFRVSTEAPKQLEDPSRPRETVRESVSESAASRR